MSYRRKKHTPSGRIQDASRQMTLSGMNADTQSEEVLLSTAELFSGQPYQRPVRDCDVAELVREWDPRLLTPLVVSYRDGRYNLVDGQHRVCAMRRKNGGKDVTALCRVYHGLTYEQEAELYYKLDKAKGHLRLSHSTKALVESGSNAEVLEIKRLLEGAGQANQGTLRDRGHPCGHQRLPAVGRRGLLPDAGAAGRGVARYTHLSQRLHPLWHGAVPQNL